jgi:hypothetical protein
LECALALDFICSPFEVNHAATDKLVRLYCLLAVDLPKFEVLKSFLFAYITNFENLPMS